MNVELVYDRDCPNVSEARASLIKAFALSGISARWREWDRSGADAPEHARRYGSPTILVNGVDVAGTEPNEDVASCRVYFDATGKLIRTPTPDAICSSLTAATQADSQGKPVHGVAAAAAAAGVALMPKLICPLCFPAYAAVMSAIGLEFFDYTPYLAPLTTVFLSLAVLVLVMQGWRSGQYVYLTLGVTAGAAVLAGKFYWENVWLTSTGFALLAIAVVQGARARRTRGAPCPSCSVELSRGVELIKERNHV